MIKCVSEKVVIVYFPLPTGWHESLIPGFPTSKRQYSGLRIYTLDFLSGFGWCCPISKASSWVIGVPGLKYIENQDKYNYKTLLDNNNVNFIVSTKKINNENYKNVFNINKHDVEYKVYQSNTTSNLGKMYYDFKTVNTTGDYSLIYDETDLQNTVVLEKEPVRKQLETATNKVNLIKQTSNNIEFEVETEKPGIFVTSLSYYPGWKATLNRQKAQIIPANINSLALEIPAGKHTIDFLYKSKAVNFGLLISFISYFALIILYVKSGKFKRRQLSPTTPKKSPNPHRP